LHSAHLLVSFLCKLALHANHGLKARIKVRYAQVQELRELCDELVVHKLKDFLGFVVFLLGFWLLGWVFAWFLDYLS